MDMAVKETIEFLQSTARSVGAEIASPWFYLQFGLILAAAGIAYAADAAIRARVDTASLAMRWPLPLRHFVRVLVASASTAIFAVLVIAERVVMFHMTWPSRSYLLMVAAKLALAWLVIRLVTSVIRNTFIVRLVSVTAWFIAALSILGLREPQDARIMHIKNTLHLEHVEVSEPCLRELKPMTKFEVLGPIEWNFDVSGNLPEMGQH